MAKIDIISLTFLEHCYNTNSTTPTEGPEEAWILAYYFLSSYLSMTVVRECTGSLHVHRFPNSVRIIIRDGAYPTVWGTPSEHFEINTLNFLLIT
eukprot:m.17391 g.17391  ORF g.17391 m.17391 type:complete len:95 (+) comp27483_c0_seq2:338-622(+)